MRLFIIFISFFILISISAIGQEKNSDTGKMIEYTNPFYQEILKAGKAFNEREEKPEMVFRMDYSKYDLPKSPDQFKKFWHTDPISQGNTGTCWAFSTTSYFESEVYRQSKKEVKLSEMHTVYWEYVEKAERFIDQRGDSYFAEGSEANALIRIWKKYGVVPASVYEGKMRGQKFHDHSKLMKEMKTYLEEVEESNAWNKVEILSTIKSILNYYLGEPPAKFSYEGKEYSPKSFLNEYLKINLDDYVDIISMKQYPLHKNVEYTVVDNWWKSKDYYNVTLDEFMSIINNAVHNGYSIVIGGDVSETGIDGFEEAAMIPSYDIPAQYINDDARQFRFSNGTTDDDHGIHIVGYKNDGNKDWYLIKDSGSRAYIGPNKGYMFYHEDYVKLKIIDFMIHKDALKGVIEIIN
jgi:bleomycin hydrolase